MTDVDGDQEFVVDLSRQHAFSIAERAVLQAGVDDDLILAVGKALQLPL